MLHPYRYVQPFYGYNLTVNCQLSTKRAGTGHPRSLRPTCQLSTVNCQLLKCLAIDMS
ncbi:MAG: hypothetical protein HC786_31840 [Richelia sp. CSU_2_1]|nr:hypothetical protein [Richelia sp. CSU_2_1]